MYYKKKFHMPLTQYKQSLCARLSVCWRNRAPSQCSARMWAGPAPRVTELSCNQFFEEKKKLKKLKKLMLFKFTFQKCCRTCKRLRPGSPKTTRTLSSPLRGQLLSWASSAAISANCGICSCSGNWQRSPMRHCRSLRLQSLVHCEESTRPQCDWDWCCRNSFFFSVQFS